MLEWSYVSRALSYPGAACDPYCFRERSAMHAKAVFFTGLGRIPVWSFAVVVQLRLSCLKCTNSSGFARACIGLLIWLLACACSGPSSQSESDVPANRSESDKPVFTVLVFTKTAEFRHESIPAGVRAIQSLGDEQHFRVDSSEDTAVFTDANLARYQVIVFLNTTGDILDLNQQAAFAWRRLCRHPLCDRYRI